MKRILVLIALGVIVAVGVWLWYRPSVPPRTLDLYFDFTARLPEAKIEDEGFLDLCWKETLSGNWTLEEGSGGLVSWSREIKMPLEWDPEILKTYYRKQPWEKYFASEGPRSATWSVEYGLQTIPQTCNFIAEANLWAATKYRMTLGQVTFWADLTWNSPRSKPMELSVRIGGREIRKVILSSRRSRHYEWTYPILDEKVPIQFLPDHHDFNPDEILIQMGVTYPSRIHLEIPEKEKRFQPDDLILYYRPKQFDGLLPPARQLATLPEDIPRSSEWIQTNIALGDIGRPALRILPGQKIRFPIWMKGDCELHLAWSDQLSRPLLHSSTGQLELAVITEASPPQVLWKEPIANGIWNPASEWNEKVLPLKSWTNRQVDLELRFKTGQALAQFDPDLGDVFDLPFAYVALSPLSTTPIRDLTRPSILFLGTDTLRADRLSCYGYQPKANPALRTSPFIDSFAQLCTRYQVAYSASSFTLPSFASILTSRYPSEHTAYVRHQPLPESLLTVTEILRDQGYQTAAFVDQGFLDPAYGMNQGFEYYDNQGGHLPKIYPRVIEWLEKRDKNRPYFLFLQYYDTHAPYWSPDEYRFKFDPNPGYNRIPEIMREAHPYWLNKFREDGDTFFTEEDYEHIGALYDGAVSWMDTNVSKFLKSTAQEEDLNPVMIVFTSDHGECLGERRQLTHGETLNEQLVRVPLLIKWPGRLRKGEEVRTPVSLLDLAPTMLDVAGIPIPGNWQGISLYSILPGMEPPQRVLYAQLPYEKKSAAMDFPYKLMMDSSFHPPEVGLFQVVKDPLEIQSLVSQEKEKTDALFEKTRQHLLKTQPLTRLSREVVFDPKVLEQLEAIGYMGKDHNSK